ncbi:MAG: sugar transferase [Vulcanimicrobiaceae bacterium]
MSLTSAALELVADRRATGAGSRGAPTEFSRVWVAALVFGDLCMFAVSAVLATAIVFHRWDALFAARGELLSASVFVALWVVIFARLGLYEREFALSAKDELYFTVAALSLGIVPQAVLFTIVPSISTSRAVLLFSAAISVVTVGGLRALQHALRGEFARRRPLRIALVGRSDRIAGAGARIGKRHHGAEIMYVAVDDLDASMDGHLLNIFGEASGIEWLDRALQWRCDELILTEIPPPQIIPSLLARTEDHGVRVAFAPPRILAHAYSLKLQQNGQQALIVPSQLSAARPSARLLKRLFDFGLALVASIVVSPVLLIAALAVWIDSGRPIFYGQERIGRYGQPFTIFKFRSMRLDAEAQSGAVWARTDDARVTRVGRWLRRLSIDELPQLLNVLRGEMSIVGPRPERPAFVGAFRAKVPRYDERHLVRPGITGWSHVNMERILDASQIADRLSYDLAYVENWSLFLDVSIVLKTGFEFLFHRAA